MATTKATTLAHTLGGISSDISTAEINRLDGVTGDLQTQLDAKAPKASPTFTGTTTVADFVPATPLSHRNMIINGAMQVAQRGVSTASITSSTFGCVDRFELISTNAGTVTMSQESDGPSGFSKSVKVLVTGANGDANNTSNSAGQLRIRQNIEAQNLQHLAYGTSDAKALTFSFYVKTNLAGTYTIRFYAEDGPRDMSTSFTVSSADASAENWKRYSVSIPADTSGTINNDNGTGFDVSIHLAMGSNYTSGSLQSAWGSLVSANRAVGNVNLVQTANNYFQLTGVQLELGSVATPFEHRRYADELLSCYRYYVQFDSNNRNYDLIFPAMVVDADDANTIYEPIVPMNHAPDVIRSDTSKVCIQASTTQYQPVNMNTILNWTNRIYFNLDIDSNSLTAGQIVYLAFVNNTTGEYFALDAEL